MFDFSLTFYNRSDIRVVDETKLFKRQLYEKAQKEVANLLVRNHAI